MDFDFDKDSVVFEQGKKKKIFSGILAWFHFQIKAKTVVLFILGFLVFCTILAWLVVADLSRPPLLDVVFFDVGQGDAIFIESPARHQILIDGGPGSAILKKLEKEMPFYDRSLDLVVLTHPESDHVSGLIEVLKKYKVKRIIWTAIVHETSVYRAWKRAIAQEGAQVTIAHAGQRVKIGKDIYLDILYPFESLENKNFKASNDTSIVSRLVFGEDSFLFTGDASKSVEYALMTRDTYLNSDVLKVGHHGSRTSSGEQFIQQVHPEIAVIQCGKNNSYGHPHPETLKILAKYDINVLRTDRDGDVKIISDGEHLGLRD